MSLTNDFNIALGSPEDNAEIIAMAPPTIAMFILRPGANGGTIVVYFVILAAINFGPAPRRIPALSSPGNFGIAGKFNFGKTVLKLGRPVPPSAPVKDAGPPNAADIPPIEVGAPKAAAAPDNVVGAPTAAARPPMLVGTAAEEILPSDKFEAFVKLTVGVNEPSDSCGEGNVGIEEKDGIAEPTDTVLDTLGKDTVGAVNLGIVASNSDIYFNHPHPKQTLYHSLENPIANEVQAN
jgi:hypothetical protein